MIICFINDSLPKSFWIWKSVCDSITRKLDCAPTTELANACEYIQEGLSFSGISVKEIAEFIKEACAHRLYVIGEHEIDTAKIVYLAGESIGSIGKGDWCHRKQAGD